MPDKEYQGKYAIVVEETRAVKQKYNIKKKQELLQEANGLQNAKQILISEINIWRQVLRLTLYIKALTYFTGLHKNGCPLMCFIGDFKFHSFFPSLLKITLHTYLNDLIEMP